MPRNLKALRDIISDRGGPEAIVEEANEYSPSLNRCKFRPDGLTVEILEKILNDEYETTPWQESYLCDALLGVKAAEFFDDTWETPIVAHNRRYRNPFAGLPDYSEGGGDPLGRDRK